MKIQATVTDISADEWRTVQERVLTEYQFGENTSRVCAVFEHRGEERHAEIPLGAFIALMQTLVYRNLANAIMDFAKQLGRAGS